MTEIKKPQWSQCKWRLGMIWLGSGAVVFLIMALMTMMDKFVTLAPVVAPLPDIPPPPTVHTQEAWGWFLTTMMPSLSLIVGVLVSEAKESTEDLEKTVDGKFYRLALGLSCFYIGMVFITLLMTSGFGSERLAGIEMLRASNAWLAPIQGLASAALGIFYVRAKPV